MSHCDCGAAQFQLAAATAKKNSIVTIETMSAITSYPFCLLEGPVCTACEIRIHPRCKRHTYPTAIGDHETRHPVNHGAPLDKVTRKEIWEGYKTLVNSVVEKLVSCANMNQPMEPTFLQYLDIPRVYRYCQECKKLVGNVLRHCSNSHLTMCIGLGVGYASKYVVKTNPKILPVTFTFRELKTFEKYLNPYFVAQLYAKNIPQLAASVQAISTPIPPLVTPARDDANMIREIV